MSSSEVRRNARCSSNPVARSATILGFTPGRGHQGDIGITCFLFALEPPATEDHYQTGTGTGRAHHRQTPEQDQP